ncbi:MAG: nicotinate (nicotinamide) nucleotide adenylyltransferase [Akkermansiaceae bacterium]|jgi:nicotinate-nucleotide adenylyltransferase|nr:nicotinate (nicotinamide) nucleotide adenylyltransferase [Akkermansiaceae bacterium]MDP4645842.1 nicotinate (nicotinamide) nucleotide adenylyltransferase [Akkermansiaceae bacterium]MDP4720444.1 nicotinate (nicotinamide) nucleotide adenylyltransferase [Akkermansiaceae bacterium]MDP4779162.1 nicotinate (nicotinamide) nucleotide adenylyltransferase [Akkermansiaceae bacterium]MDP4848225.1 nicotinate (nicotinamide) nucleotide adenylyltransferase [Akkermansiaceae bacterium]
MRKIGIFGGSFDPIHEGHIHLANLARTSAGLDEVWFLPCHISPHKKDRPPTPGETRVKWLELALADIPWAKIEPVELRSESPSYSWHTLQTLYEEYPGNEWFWIMGGDQWTALHTWSKPEILANLASFIVLARDGSVIEERPGFRLHLVHGEHPASSTEIRRALEAGEKGIPFLDPAVELEISQHPL